MKYSVAIFDMDGTILNTLQDLYLCTNHALRLNNFPERTLEEIRTFVGNGIGMLIKRAAPEGTSIDIRKKIFEDFMEYYNIHCSDNTAPYNGIIELLKKLKDNGVKTAVLSNKSDEAVQILAKQYFNGLFDIALGERNGINRKPSPDGVYEILNFFNTDKTNAVYIGDSDVDVETAKNSGLDCIGVEWGFKGRKFLESLGVKMIADCAKEVEKFIL